MLPKFPYRVLPGGRRVRDYAGLTVDSLLAAVGDDESQAEDALQQEQESPKPRKTAVRSLERIAQAGEDE